MPVLKTSELTGFKIAEINKSLTKSKNPVPN
jgi:hypothetical protein